MVVITQELIKRQLLGCYSYNGYNCNNRWYDWGRWVLLAVIIVIFILCILVMWASSRRRARQGRQPLYGTGWMVPPSYHQSQQQYDQQAYGGSAPAPPYMTGDTTGHQQGYYDTNGNWVPTVRQNDNNNNGNFHSGPDYEYAQAAEDQARAQGQQNTNYAPPPRPPPNYGGSSSNNEYEMNNLPTHPAATYTKN